MSNMLCLRGHAKAADMSRLALTQIPPPQ